MKMRMLGAGKARLSVAAKFSCICGVRLPATSLHPPSILLDVIRSRQTGIDFLNGAIVAKKRVHGNPPLVNSCIVDPVKFRESLNPAEGS